MICNAILVTIATIGLASAYVPQSSFAGSRINRRLPSSRISKTLVMESFGFDFAEDQAENTDPLILGEAKYKQWVGEIDDNSFLNRQYNIIRRVNEKGLLKLTAESGLLEKLEANGVDLKTLESLLPLADDVKALSLVGNNQQLLINALGPLLVEPAPLLIPALAGALEVGPLAFFGLAAVALGTDAFLVLEKVQIPFVGLSAGFYLGLLLIPVAVLGGGAGVALSSTRSQMEKK